MRKIGLDLGSKRIGVALSDPLGIFASPYAVLTDIDPPGLRAYLEDLIAREGADEVVVGMPYTLKGEEGPQARWVRDYAACLEGLSGVKVTFFDERYTSREAVRRLREAGTSGRKARVKTDSAAAALLLEAYLQSGGG
jgi:putative Holliday junction resolvase